MKKALALALVICAVPGLAMAATVNMSLQSGGSSEVTIPENTATAITVDLMLFADEYALQGVQFGLNGPAAITGWADTTGDWDCIAYGPYIASDYFMDTPGNGGQIVSRNGRLDGTVDYGAFNLNASFDFSSEHAMQTFEILVDALPAGVYTIDFVDPGTGGIAYSSQGAPGGGGSFSSLTGLTIMTPEPASLALLALGGLALIRRR